MQTRTLSTCSGTATQPHASAMRRPARRVQSHGTRWRPEILFRAGRIETPRFTLHDMSLRVGVVGALVLIAVLMALVAIAQHMNAN